MSTSSAAYIFDILRLVGSEPHPLGATDVSRRLGLSLTTAHRGLNTLERANYIVRYQSSTKYVLGDMSRSLLHSFFSRFALREVALPYMQRLVVMTGETVSLFVPVGWYVVRASSVKGTNEVIHTGPIGEVRELDKSMAGRVALAFMPAETRSRFLGGARDTPEAVLTRIEKRGFAVGDGKVEQGHIGMPILGADGPLGVIAIEGRVATGSDAAPHALEPFLSVTAELSRLVQANPHRYADPYAHIDPDTIRLPSRS